MGIINAPTRGYLVWMTDDEAVMSLYRDKARFYLSMTGLPRAQTMLADDMRNDFLRDSPYAKVPGAFGDLLDDAMTGVNFTAASAVFFIPLDEEKTNIPAEQPDTPFRGWRNYATYVLHEWLVGGGNAGKRAAALSSIVQAAEFTASMNGTSVNDELARALVQIVEEATAHVVASMDSEAKKRTMLWVHIFCSVSATVDYDAIAQSLLDLIAAN